MTDVEYDPTNPDHLAVSSNWAYVNNTLRTIITLNPEEDMTVSVHGRAWAKPYSWVRGYQDDAVLCAVMYPPKHQSKFDGLALVYAGIQTQFQLVVERPLPTSLDRPGPRLWIARHRI